MQTEIHFVDGKSLVLDESATVKTSDLGVEVVERTGDNTAVRVLYPWARIEKVVQTGIGVGSVYTY
jgi:hypothetical protein